MSCYFRHLKEIFSQAGLAVTQENKKAVDQALHELAGVPYKACPEAWKAIKEKYLADEAGRKALGKALRVRSKSL
ncbi:MAG: hypothetical protein QHH30_02630 [candidate division NC10 bacterium]|nr:hypothetical protein [candidate division NC10 bacterium]